MKNKNHIHQALYLRNSAAYDHDFWCTCLKWYLQMYFSFFQHFDFWVVRGGEGRGVKGGKIVQNDKKFCLSCSIEPYIIWLFYGTHLWNDNIFRSFYFFKILILWYKITKNSVSLFIFQESYIIWSSFMVYMYKKIISPGIFLIFSKLWFSGSLWRLKGKKSMTQNDKKFCLCHSVY